jgi:hypothetical protein
MKYGNAFFAWLPLGVGITGVCLLVSLAVQQDLRQSFNDPQVQIAEDTVYALQQGSTTASVLKNFPRVDIAKSLSPWVGVYDASYHPLGSSGKLDGVQPALPKGVYDAAASNSGKDTQIEGQNRVTWQPESGVRVATVVQHYGGGFVVSGRNMSELEIKENNLNLLIFFAWVAIMLTTFFVQIASGYMRKR